ncbi:amidohydrolase family protein [Salinigranum sp. GCM10025319]|uniref:amidohydrolase family protein n=1 Tax=Salinigranum sp. GCM10025319 TaxID=3252687 RepID=UPI003623646A
MQVEGTILTGRDFDPIEGRVVVEDGRIEAIERTATDSSDIVCPAFVNAHTHIGDSIAKEAGRGLSLDELVAPPDGLKHRLLRETSAEEKVAAMRRSLRFMESTGTAACVEFREGGVAGVEAFGRARDGLDVEAVVLGRETEAAMHASDGFGASGARDSDFAELRRATREADKLFGVHAGERDSHDVDGALDLDPDFLVHMVHATDEQLGRVAREELPIVVCPRSNLVTKVGAPPIAKLAEHTTLALGTDNVMLDSPSMFREMEFAAKLSDVSAEAVLRMATVNGAEIAGLDYGIVEEGTRAKLLVLDGDSDNLAGARDPVRAVVRRAGQADVKRVVL